MKIQEIAQKDGILVREIDGKFYAGGAIAWSLWAIQLYEKSIEKT